MNISYIIGRPETSNTVKEDISEYVRRVTEINRAFYKTFKFGPGTNDDNVATLRGLSAYYRKYTVHDMNLRQITNLADATKPDDPVMLIQARSLLAPKTISEIIRRNRYGFAIIVKCNNAIPLALYVCLQEGVYVQEPLRIFYRSNSREPIQQEDRNDAFLCALYYARTHVRGAALQVPLPC